LNNPFTLKGKNIVITGASSGIGRQCAISCSQMGASLVLIARNEERLKETYNNLERGDHLYYSQDITKYEEIKLIIKDTVAKIGKISGFIHSAGIEMTLPLKIMKPEYYNELYSVNVISGFEFAKIISKKKYLDSKGASFVFIASIMGVLGQAGKIGYCSSKSSLISGIKAMSLELVNKRIRCNTISPSVVKTEMSKKMFDSLSEDSKKEIEHMHPLGLGDPRDIANACIYLLSDASKWVTGTNLIVDGGYSAK